LKKSHNSSVTQILKYLKGSLNLHITYQASGKFHVLSAYFDTDYVTNIHDIKSKLGFILLLNGRPIAWRYQRQGYTIGSIAKAEYIAIHLEKNKVVWIFNLLS
jgi:hypothetical protein